MTDVPGSPAPPPASGRSTVSLLRPGFVRTVASTTVFTMGSTVIAALAGLIIARTLGASGRGEYAAVTAWYGAFLVVGELGQMAATCFFVAREPQRARDYVATSRAMMIVTGLTVMTAGLLLAPLLSGGRPDLERSYQIGFVACFAGCVGISYLAALQGRNIGRWNLVRTAQPAFFLTWILVLLLTNSFTLTAVLWAVACTVALQTVVAHVVATRSGLGGGRSRRALVPPLGRYGVSQLLAVTPLAVNTHLDQLVLSQTVPLADLGLYAVAVSVTSLAVPLVAAVGYVAFPRLAAREPLPGGARRLQFRALLGSAAASALLLVPLAIVAGWLIPWVFGAQFAGSVPLIWILTPGGIFLACGQVAGDLLRGRNRPLAVAWAQGLAAVLTIALLFVFLPFLGVAGAAVASTIAYGSALAVMVYRLFRLPNDAVPVGDLPPTSPSGGSASEEKR